MNETEKKVGSLAIFALLILFIVIKNNKKENSRIHNKKFTVVTIENSEVFGKNFTKNNFYFQGKYRENYSKLLYKNQRDSIIGKSVLIEYDSTNLDNSKIIFGYEIPQYIPSPKNGWKSIPKNFKKIY